MAVVNPFDFFVEAYAETFPFAYPSESRRRSSRPISRRSGRRRCSTPLLAVDRRASRSSTVDFLVDAQPAPAAATIGYIIRMEPGVQTPEETLTLASGSCRDSAWLLVQVLRHSASPRASSPAT